MGMMKSVAKTVFGIDVLFLLLLGFSFLYIEPGSGSYVVAVITLIPIVLTLVASIVIMASEWEPFE